MRGNAPLLICACLGCVAVSHATVAAPPDAMLSMAANASGRPRECASPSSATSRTAHLTIWDSARQPLLRRHCDLLGRAHSRLAKAPAAAREAALVADQILPGYAAPWVVMGRAEVVLGRYEDALRDFDKAQQIDARSLEEPHALRDLAAARRKLGKIDDALSAYRALIPRLALLGSVEERAVVLLEAASVAMERGGDGLREAIVVLNEARDYPANPFDAQVVAYLALALDRSGAVEQSAELLAVMRARNYELPVAASLDSYPYLMRRGDAYAMIGLASEASQPKKSAEQWEKYVSESSTSPWRDHGKRHLDKVRSPAQKAKLPPAKLGPGLGK